MEKNRLSGLSLSQKVLATGIILTLLLGYLVAYIQIFDRSHFNMQETIESYRGDESGDPNAISIPKSFASILSITHVHSFSQPFIFASIGFIFVFASWREKTKALFISLGFIGTVLSNLTPWLIRYAAGHYVYLYPISQAMMTLSILVMSYVSLKQMWFSKDP